MVATVLAWSPTASAQVAPQGPEAVETSCPPGEPLPGPERAAQERDGVRGFWFRRDIGLRLLCEVRVLEQLRPRVELLTERLRLRDQQLERREAMYQLAIDGEERALRVGELAVEDAARARRALDAWYRHPVLWTVVGVVLGGFAVYLGGKTARAI